jgi:hypothetical protein
MKERAITDVLEKRSTVEPRDNSRRSGRLRRRVVADQGPNVAPAVVVAELNRRRR